MHAKKRAILLLSITFLANLPVYALDPTSQIKSQVLLKTGQSWDGHALSYPTGPAEITGMLIEIAPHAQTGWHEHPVPSFGYILQGELTVRLQQGQSKTLKAGEAIAEVVSTLHNGYNTGDIPVKLVVFYAGTSGQALTIKATDAPKD